MYANVAAVEKESLDGSVESQEIGDDDLKRLREAQSVFRDLAARMRAFALNETFAVGIVKMWGYDPMEASTALLGMEGTLHRYGRSRNEAKAALEKLLNFRTTA